MTYPPPIQTLKRTKQEQEPDQPTNSAPPQPNVMSAPMQMQYKPSPETMPEEELDLYVKRLSMKHKRVSTKWWGLRRKYSKDECPYCGIHTQGGYCTIHQRDYDEYIAAMVAKQNRKWI